MTLKICNKLIYFILISAIFFSLSSCESDKSAKIADEDLKCEIKNPEYKFLEETPCICNKKCALKAFNDLIIGEDGYVSKWEGIEPVEIRVIGKNMKQDFNEVKKLIEKPVDLINAITPFDLKIVYDPQADKKLYKRSILIFYVDDIEDAIRNDFPDIIDLAGRDEMLEIYLNGLEKKEKMSITEKPRSFLIKMGSFKEPFVFNILFLKKEALDQNYINNSIARTIGLDSGLNKKNIEFYNNEHFPLLLFHNLILLYNNEKITSGKTYKDIEALFKEIYKNEDPVVAYVGKNKAVYEKLMSRIRFILKKN
jgi:hypothetical protein